MKLNKFVFVILLLIIPFSNLVSQLDKRLYYSYGDRFYSETIVLPHPNPDSITVVSMIELMYSMLQFNQFDSKDETQFKAPINIDYIFKDKTGIIRKRSFYNDTAFALSYENTLSRDDFFSNSTVI